MGSLPHIFPFLHQFLPVKGGREVVEEIRVKRATAYISTDLQLDILIRLKTKKKTKDKVIFNPFWDKHTFPKVWLAKNSASQFSSKILQSLTIIPIGEQQ